MGRVQLDHVHLGSLAKASNDQLLRAGASCPTAASPNASWCCWIPPTTNFSGGHGYRLQRKPGDEKYVRRNYHLKGEPYGDWSQFKAITTPPVEPIQAVTYAPVDWFGIG